jgi:hypothetical protein
LPEDQALVPPTVSDLPDSDDADHQEAALTSGDRRRETQGGPAEEDEAPDEIVESMRARTAVEHQMREQQAEHLMQVANSNARVAQTDMNAASLALTTVNEKIQASRAALIQAREQGDAAMQLQMEEALQNLQTVRTEIEQARAQIPDPRSIINHARNKASQLVQNNDSGTVVAPGMRAAHPLAEKWAANNKWLRDPSNKDAAAAVVEISSKMAASGWDFKQSGFYSELSKRLQGKFPNIKVAQHQAPKQAAGKPQVRTAVAPGRGSGGQSQAQPKSAGSRYTLTGDDVRAMQRMNLDPKSDKHRKAFAKARMERSTRAAG